METSTKVSIITICYNSEDNIEKTIQSVVTQTYTNIEYILVDGKSTDGTCKIIEKHLDKISVFISEKDRGISDAFNKGISKASGKIVCFLNSGDSFIDKEAVAFVVNEWNINNEDVLFFQAQVGTDKISPNPKYKDNAESIWKSMDIPHQASFFRRSLFDEIGSFNIFLKIRMDYDLFARCVKNGCTYRYLKKKLVLYDDQGISSNISNRYLFVREGINIRRLYGFHVPIREYLRLIKWKLFSEKMIYSQL